MQSVKSENKNRNYLKLAFGQSKTSDWSWALGGLALAGSAATVLTLGAANWLVAKVIEPANLDWKEQYQITPYEFEVDYINVLIPTVGGRLLRGWYLQHPGERRVIVIAHGYRGCKEEMVTLAVFLWKAGFNVLLFNYRGHGYERLKDELLTLGNHELEDYQAAIAFVFDYFKQSGQAEPVIGAMGGSMGAAVALVAAARDQRIKAVWADSSFTSREAVIAYQWQKTTRIPFYPLMAATDWFFVRRTGHRLADFSPLGEIKRIAPRPVYFLHGTADEIIPVEQAYALYEAAQGPKSLWIEEGLHHCGIYFAHRHEYRRRITAFFQEWLASDSQDLALDQDLQNLVEERKTA
jgi:dipeptidyl aminopeptidase/acylaminoacyl peptidase